VLEPFPFYLKEGVWLSAVVSLVCLEHTKFMYIETKIALKIICMFIIWNKNTEEGAGKQEMPAAFLE